MLVRQIERLPEGTPVLDAAVGLGQLSEKVRRKGMRTFGVDASFEAALYATRSGSAKAVVGDLTTLPFRDRVFSAVMSGETLEISMTMPQRWMRSLGFSVPADDAW
ncbi:MAG: class I SAM-dependent methyltransferase [Acidobacteria bacterium]|nr:class I SAM-dependent methyltransferase [Acidobacteriota bacterium]